MASTVKANGHARQANSSVLCDRDEDKALVLLRQHFCEAIAESGIKEEAIAYEMGIDPPYLSKLKSGEKSITARTLVSLPDKVEAIFERKRAESLGHIVVTPIHDRTEALKAVVAGVIGMMSQPALPERAERMVKAELPEKKVKTA